MHYSFAMKSLQTFLYFTLVSIRVNCELQSAYITKEEYATFKINFFNKNYSVPSWRRFVDVYKNNESFKELSSLDELDRTFDTTNEFGKKKICLKNVSECVEEGNFNFNSLLWKNSRRKRYKTTIEIFQEKE